MKLVAMVGTQSKASPSQTLLAMMKKRYANQAVIEVAPIHGMPMFDETAAKMPAEVAGLAHQIAAADGVIIATPEYAQWMPAALKSVLEWFSRMPQLFEDKPVMVIGVSADDTGAAFAAASVKQVLSAAGLSANVLGGGQFALRQANAAFVNGTLRDQAALDQLDRDFTRFAIFVRKQMSVDAQTSPTQAYLNLNTDVVTGASEETDAQTGASEAVDPDTESENNDKSEGDQPREATTSEQDATTGASEH